ncbi:MAG: hypothetical protein ACF8NJ_07905 [Phycisphaerales bacterium JB038]
MKRDLKNILSGLSVLFIASLASAQLHDGDIIVGLQDNQIVTGVPGDGGEPDFGERVFATAFSDFLPNWTDMPGYDSVADTWQPGTQIGLDIQAALRVWDDVNDDFLQIPEERLTVSKGGESITTPLSDAVVPGFVFGSANSSGKIHEHVGYELLAPMDDGIYLLQLTLWSTEPTIEESSPFWILFNKNEEQQTLEDAGQWVRDNLLGVPGDLTGDGCVDQQDLGILLAAYELTGEGDVDGDGDTDQGDLGILLANYDNCD